MNQTTQEVQTGNAREEWLDAARIPAMFFIILFHTGLGGASWQIFQPLLFFFFLSGYWTPAARFSYAKWWRRLVALAVPYVLWNTFSGMADSLTWGRIYGIGPDGRFCADYPLWYLRALVLMMLVYPLFRRALWLPAGLACLFVAWGNNWHCDWAMCIPLPDPMATFAFFAGCCCSIIKPPLLRRVLQTIGLPVLALVVWHAACPFLPRALAEAAGMFSLFSLAAWLPYLPRVCSALGRCSRATFLAFATHAGVIVAVQRAMPRVVDNLPAACALSLLCYATAYALLRLMERHCPRLLPYLAHQGRLPWLYRREHAASCAPLPSNFTGKPKN